MCRFCLGWQCWAAFFGLFVLALPLAAADRLATNGKNDGSATAAVDMFAAMEKGQIEVQFFPRDATQARLLVTNKTDEPISVALPSAFAATPVLAQIARPGRQGIPGVPGTDPGQTGSKAPQPLATAPPANMNANNLNGRNNAGPNPAGPNPLGPLFNIPPEKVGQLNVRCVCLDPKRGAPSAHVPYEVKPLADVCSKPELYEVCRLLGDAGVKQKALQAAAWHIANGLSWDELAAKRTNWLPCYSGYFNRSELQEAKKLVEAAAKKAEDQKARPSASSAQYSTPHP